MRKNRDFVWIWKIERAAAAAAAQLSVVQRRTFLPLLRAAASQRIDAESVVEDHDCRTVLFDRPRFVWDTFVCVDTSFGRFRLFQQELCRLRDLI